MSTLTPRLRAQVELAILAGILKPVDKAKPHFGEGVVAVMCPDGDQAGKKQFLAQLVTAQHGQERVHDVGKFHGGALVLSPTSPLSSMAPFLATALAILAPDRAAQWAIKLAQPLLGFAGRAIRLDLLLLSFLAIAIDMKKIRTVVLYVHAPCGAAQHAGLDFFDELRHLVAAKRFLKRRLGHLGLKVPCFVHVNFGGGQEETYFVKTHEVEAWLAQVAP